MVNIYVQFAKNTKSKVNIYDLMFFVSKSTENIEIYQSSFE